MRFANIRRLLLVSLALGALCGALQSEASLEHLLSRRFVFENENETNANSNVGPSPALVASNNKPTDADPARLYPDLKEPIAGPAPTPNQGLPPALAGPTPFLPFGPQPVPPAGGGYASWPFPSAPIGPPPVQPPSQRAPDQTFASGLGQRLLKLVQGNSNSASNSTTGNGNDTQLGAQALRNATVLEQLNRGVHSVYDGLAKAYNSTIQRQMDLLQQRLNNNTNGDPWHQRFASQMTNFYKTMADRANHAQENLNEAWTKFRNANSSELQNRSSSSSQNYGVQLQPNFFNTNFDSLQAGGNDFFQNFQKHLNFGGGQASPLQQEPPNSPNPANGNGNMDMTHALREFWANQVRPHIHSARNMISRTWHDLTANQAYNQAIAPAESTITSRNSNSNLGSSQSSSNSGGGLLDDIFKDINLSGPEYTIMDGPNGTGDGNNKPTVSNGITSSMHNSLMSMQRDLTQLWAGLTNSLQDAMKRMQQSSHHNANNNNRQPANKATSSSTVAPDASASENVDKMKGMDVDESENEISAKLQDISNVQREADKVYELVQKEQLNQKIREQQQQQAGFSNRLKQFYNNLNIDDNVNKGLSAVNDFWHQIPDRWTSLMNNMKSSTSSNNTTSSTN